jgi:hypothetical protein
VWNRPQAEPVVNRALAVLELYVHPNRGPNLPQNPDRLCRQTRHHVLLLKPPIQLTLAG